MTTTTSKELEAKKPGLEALRLHPFYRGKIEVVPKCFIRGFEDFAVWYTPGVAEPCKVIHRRKEAVYEYTNKWNSVAVVSDGSRVLGLGDIGPEAGLPVMEGKALLFKYLGGVDAYPICLDTKNPDEIITAVKWIKPSFGGVNLEDLATPKCFYILDRLRRELDIPVWHDDQQGTATIVLAGLINSLKLVGKKLGEVVVTLVGAGAANIAIARILSAAGFEKGNLILVDSKGILNQSRKDLWEGRFENPYKWELCLTTNAEQREGGIVEALNGVDVVVAASRPGPGVIPPEAVRSMADDPIVFATANPVPEIWPWEAKEAGAKIVATGRSDFPNQINNSLGFPGIFRGVLDVMAKTITDEMCIAAAYELAKAAEEKGLSEEYVVPTMDDWEVFPREAAAVGVKAIEQGVARRKITRKKLFETSMELISRARRETEQLMRSNIIKKPVPTS
ncbi:MAG: malate dehydrogenase [Methanobacteriota archaeon]|nr:MAG: malate dehydrogenase [Euryarchaeota archaeon]